MSDDGKSLSKIDRFLACRGFVDIWSSATVSVLNRLYSDHSPLLLVNDILDFGPSPFKFYNSWLCLIGLNEVVLNSWSRTPGSYYRLDRRLLLKLKNLKSDIKGWKAQMRAIENHEHDVLCKKIEEMELLAKS